jgi:trigger factor
MSVTVKNLPKSQVELTITVPYEEYQKAEALALEDISKEIKVDGFRSGHIPENVIREKVDPKTIFEVTMQKLIPLSYSKTVQENNIQVIAHPKIEVKKQVEKEGDELVYTAVVSVVPDVKLGDYKKIKVKKKDIQVSEKEIEETIAMLMERFAEWEDVDRASKEGDRVEVDFEGFDESGAVIPNTASKNHPVVLGSKSMIPGFEEQLTGVSKGEEKEFDITFPKKYHAEQMQGKKVKFKAKVHRIEAKKDQTLDEDMVEKITGQKQPVEDFKKRVSEDLEKEMKMREQQQVDNQVVSEIIKVTQAELPEELVQEELKMLKEEQKKRVEQQGLSWEQYLNHIKKTDEDFEQDHRKAAEDRLLARLGVNKIIKEEKVQVTDEEVKKKIEELISQYPENARSQVQEHYKEGSEAFNQLKNNMAADKLISMFVVEK